MKPLDKNSLEQNARFFDRWAASYDRGFVQWWMQKFQQPVLTEINLSKGSVLLDLSCGIGQLLDKIHSLGKESKLYGIDYSSSMLEKARSRLPKEVNLQQADVHALPFKDETFDYVISTEAFHHYYNQQQALKEMHRITKNNGKVIIVDINFFLRPLHWLFEKVEPGCVHINSRREMRELFEKTGLRNIRQYRTFLFAVITIGERT